MDIGQTITFMQLIETGKRENVALQKQLRAEKRKFNQLQTQYNNLLARSTSIPLKRQQLNRGVQVDLTKEKQIEDKAIQCVLTSPRLPVVCIDSGVQTYIEVASAQSQTNNTIVLDASSHFEKADENEVKQCVIREANQRIRADETNGSKTGFKSVLVLHDVPLGLNKTSTHKSKSMSTIGSSFPSQPAAANALSSHDMFSATETIPHHLEIGTVGGKET